MFKRVVCTFLLLAARGAAAVTSGMTLLTTGATDNASYEARFAIGLTVDGGRSWQSSANLYQSVLIKASFDPAPAHVNGKADIFVIEWYEGQLAMLTANGAWLPWSGKIAELQPARDDVLLAASQELTIYEGAVAAGGRHQLYIGYLPAGSNAIIYSATGAAFSVNAVNVDAQTWFTQQLFDDIVMTRCALCHVAGGVAGSSDLRFIKDMKRAQENFDIFQAFYRQQANGYKYVLEKVSGGDKHGGGIPLALGGTDYQKMAAFLALLDGATLAPPPTGTALFAGVRDQGTADTLRDAALLLAGRLPTPAETSAVAAGTDASLRPVLLQLMQGEHFHDFIKDGANDRLFLRGNEDFNLADDCATCFPALNAEFWRLQELVDRTGAAAERRNLNEWVRRLNYSMEEAPLELIAYVVENNRPYSEILTANYDMLTPVLNAAVGGTAVFPATANPVAFRPGQIKGYYLRDAATSVQVVPGAAVPRILHPGNLRIDYPHVGILNSKSFLSRYPTTATNRNRARARWTYYNFLGVDIEALATRSTDPVALADTNNPTLNNPACSVCHNLLDPVAGTFQDYADNGVVRASLNGTDSLDRVYKATRGGPYRAGDTWYADMRNPGFESAQATGANTLRWLAERIVQDRRFASATVRFWWPAVMGAELLKAPEVLADVDYGARLTAYSAQQLEVDALTDKFIAARLELKQLLADMILSRWYRIDRLDSTNIQELQAAARSIANLTGEKLLTPEQLARKTHALTGFNWNATLDAITAATVSGLEGDYNTFYGGIDSFALKVRARTMTPLMSNVAATHALETACPVVLGDFIRPDARRLLFDKLSPWLTPLTEASATQLLTTATATEFRPSTLTVALQPGPKKVVMSLLNDACNHAASPETCRATKNLIIGSINITAPGGQTAVISGSSAVRSSCAVANGSSLVLNASCTADYGFNATVAGNYTVTANLAAMQAAGDPVLAGMNIEADVAPATATTSGALALKKKLVELHYKLLGQTLTVNSPELLASYDLLLQTWQERKAGNFAPALLGNARTCDWSRDIGFIGTLTYPGIAVSNGRYNTAAINTWLGPLAQDPLYMKQSWVVVMTYLLSHYDYLHE